MTDGRSIPLPAVLELVALQLEVAMQHAASQAGELSSSIARIAALGGSAELAAEAHRAMTAMQFHDQLAQRVKHVREALADVHDELVSGRDPDWSALVTRMRSHYTMEDERRLFDMVMNDPPRASSRREEELMPGNVEMF